jgi:oligopeptide transport system substrate-binding protein
MIKHFKGFSCAVLSALLFLTACTESSPPTYTFRTYTAEMPQTLHPHEHSENADYAASFTELGLVLGSEEEWYFAMAEEITDITASFSDRSKWGITDTKGRVFRIALNQSACWDDGTPITADTYMDSMKLLLEPAEQNSHAEPYTSGTAAILGADAYFRGGSYIYEPCVAPYGEDELADYSFDLTEEDVYLHLTTHEMTLTDEHSIRDIYEAGYIDPALYTRIEAQADKYGYIRLTEKNEEDIHTLCERVLIFFGLRYEEDYFKEMLFRRTGEKRDLLPFSKIGLFKSGAYELTYITAESLTREEFLACMTENWIVHPKGMGKSLKEHPSYGPYSIYKVQKECLIYKRNDKWYGWKDSANETLFGTSDFIRCAILDEEEAAVLYEKGVLDLLWDASANEYRLSDRLSDEDGVHRFRYVYDDAAWEEYVRARGGYPYR